MFQTVPQFQPHRKENMRIWEKAKLIYSQVHWWTRNDCNGELTCWVIMSNQSVPWLISIPPSGNDRSVGWYWEGTGFDVQWYIFMISPWVAFNLSKVMFVKKKMGTRLTQIGILKHRIRSWQDHYSSFHVCIGNNLMNNLPPTQAYLIIFY